MKRMCKKTNTFHLSIGTYFNNKTKIPIINNNETRRGYQINHV